MIGWFSCPSLIIENHAIVRSDGGLFPHFSSKTTHVFLHLALRSFAIHTIWNRPHAWFGLARVLINRLFRCLLACSLAAPSIYDLKLNLRNRALGLDRWQRATICHNEAQSPVPLSFDLLRHTNDGVLHDVALQGSMSRLENSRVGPPHGTTPYAGLQPHTWDGEDRSHALLNLSSPGGEGPQHSKEPRSPD